MKKFVFFVLFSLSALVFHSCSNLTPQERKMKKHITHYLKEELNDPQSLTDLTIDYAVMTDTLDDLWHAAMDRGDETEYPFYIKGKKVAIVNYRAKNAYGAYRKGTDVYTYSYIEIGDIVDIEPLKNGHAYAINFNAFDWKRIE
jgi:hypothetical protein